ncbi:MAG: hypothetical protein SWO11_19270 [Thermodesulfobacteriota bacterium]|nr:hypothetical protein [Thermodesulfobacteriota bacterium]
MSLRIGHLLYNVKAGHKELDRKNKKKEEPKHLLKSVPEHEQERFSFKYP